ncbi:MAG: ATP-binding protein [Ahrensia sp.]|nr:ATP-binding protein [Ahrensia sp.]
MLPVIRRRLHRQIYFTVVITLLAILLASSAFFALVERRQGDNPFELIAKLVIVALPPADAPVEVQRRRLEEMAAETRVGIALYGPDQQLIAKAGRVHRRFRTPDFDDLDFDPDDEQDWEFDGRSRGWVTRLPDGRYFQASHALFRRRPPLLGLLAYVALIIAVIGLAAWPFVRRLTGRVERLQRGVERVGEGDLSSRVDVEGSDEIAALATSFNTSAERIERLVNSNRQLLAHASHELRTPLARVRLGVEMLREKEDPKRRAALERDIAELDSLIDEILTMSRLDTGAAPQMNETIDLLALAAEECARYEACTVDGVSVNVCGNSKLLARLIRNLVDNAHRHGKPPIGVRIGAEEGHAILRVMDAGPGIPIDQRDKVFDPFYRGAGKQNVEGYGLGLALVAQIARAHGGSVRISDGQFSAVIVTLPMR